MVQFQRSVSHLVRSGQGSGFDGLAAWRLGTPGSHRLLSVSDINCAPTQVSRVIRQGLLGPVSIGFPSEPRFGPTGPDKLWPITQLSCLDVPLMYGPPSHSYAPSGAPLGPDIRLGSMAAMRRPHRTP